MKVQNLTRIEIENFQSIEFVTIPLNNTGVHWINGKPNVGKSAVLKAVQALFMNVSNHKYKEMIRDGQDHFRVKGYFGDNDWVELVRGENDQYSWILDGQAGIMEKTQGKVPFEVNQYYQLYWTGDKIKRHLNFTLVGDQLFFVETTSGDNTLILEKALGTDRLTRVGKYSDTEKREVRSELRTIHSFHEESDNKLEQLAKEVNDGTERLSGLDRLEKTLDIEVATYEKVETLSTSIQQLARIAQVVKEVEDSLASVDTGSLQEEIKLYDKVANLHTKKTRLEELQREQDELEVDIDVTELKEDITMYQKVSKLHDKRVRLQGLLAEEQELTVNITKEEVTTLEKEVKEYNEVVTKATKLMSLTQSKEELDSQLQETAQEYQELLDKKEEFLSQFEVCPFCERPMGSEHGAC